MWIASAKKALPTALNASHAELLKRQPTTTKIGRRDRLMLYLFLDLATDVLFLYREKVDEEQYHQLSAEALIAAMAYLPDSAKSGSRFLFPARQEYTDRTKVPPSGGWSPISQERRRKFGQDFFGGKYQFPKTAHGHSPLEWLPSVPGGRFPCFTLISHMKPQNPSKSNPIYYYHIAHALGKLAEGSDKSVPRIGFWAQGWDKKEFLRPVPLRERKFQSKKPKSAVHLLLEK